jgi:hypothetical protein
MLRTSGPISQRLIRKGALVEETYNLFRNWKDEMSFDQNFNHSLHGSFRSEAWKKEVHSTLRRRFRDFKAADSLIWTGPSGSKVQLTLTSGGKRPITIPARRITERHQKSGITTFEENGVTYLQDFHTTQETFIIPGTPSTPK